MIRPCTDADFDAVLSTMNDGAEAYRGIIPEDCWKEPYMSADELRYEMASGISFSGAETGGSLVGVMGVQPVDDVILIRHAYVQTGRQHRGIGSSLLAHLVIRAPRPVLIGTWKAARWAVRFYEKNDFGLVEGGEKNRLLRRYWDISNRQIENSVVMADGRALREVVITPAISSADGDDGIDIFKL